MLKKLYNMMNWPEIETICFGESDQPHDFLGATKVGDDTLIQTFYPGAEKVFCVIGNKKTELDKMDEAGFFAGLLKGNHIDDYSYLAILEGGEKDKYKEVYNTPVLLNEEQCKKFSAGVGYETYKMLGAHPYQYQNVKGYLFAVWAPNALRVSVVGDFNDWNGYRHPMRRHKDSGIFELFIPDVKEKENYKYEISIKGGATFLKTDPYANAMQKRPDTASVTVDLSKYAWQDELYLKKRKENCDYSKQPISIYELHLGSFKKPEDGRDFFNYRELAEMVVDYVKDMGYTHVELMPIMEHPLDESWGYQVTGYYAPTARYGTPTDFKYFVNELHKANIGIILDWVPAHFPRDAYALSCYDGTCLYEHLDPKRANHPHWGTLNYNYARPEVTSFLLSNALFWIEEYHIDALRMDAVASMLYLDYGKGPGEWYANLYGGNENLEAIEFIKHFNSIIHKFHEDVFTVAEESTTWPKVTGSLEDDGLGFDFKWNIGFMNDYLKYIVNDPYFRSHYHNDLTFSMIYNYTENFMLEFSHDEVVYGKGSMFQKMPGDLMEKLANLRASFAYMMTHPGKKLLFMGQDFAQNREWSEKEGLDWNLLKEEEYRQINDMMRDCNSLYKNHPALYEQDYQNEGFEWINHLLSEQNMLIFMRKSKDDKEVLIVVANFANVARNNYRIGVPFEGKYKEIFNSDHEKYGGSHYINSRIKMTKEIENDMKPYSFTMRVAPLSVSVIKYMGDTIISLEDEKKKRNKEDEDQKTSISRRKKKAVIQPMKKKR